VTPTQSIRWGIRHSRCTRVAGHFATRLTLKRNLKGHWTVTVSGNLFDHMAAKKIKKWKEARADHDH
jgi:hypothetical protein